MEVLREVRVHTSSRAQADALIAELAKNLPSGWSREQTMEIKYEHIFYPNRIFCFTYDGDDRIPQADIIVGEGSDGRELWLSSVFTPTMEPLGIGQSNDLREKFHRELLVPVADRLGVGVSLTPRDLELGHWMSRPALDKFRRFSAGANKHAGYLLPEDRERWLDFVLTAHRERSSLDGDILRRWLVEIEGWAPEVADQLAAQYAFGGELLSFSESQAAGV